MSSALASVRAWPIGLSGVRKSIQIELETVEDLAADIGDPHRPTTQNLQTTGNGAEPMLDRFGPLDFDHRPQPDHRVPIPSCNQGDGMEGPAQLNDHPVGDQGFPIRPLPHVAGLDDRPAPADDAEIKFGHGTMKINSSAENEMGHQHPPIGR